MKELWELMTFRYMNDRMRIEIISTGIALWILGAMMLTGVAALAYLIVK